jgi:chemotaxis signal transduction protein
MSTDVWGGDNDGEYNGLFAIRKSLDGEQSAEFVDKEQFIGIKIGREEFLLTIGVVNEIIMLPHITWVPNSAQFVEGVINLRGTILPVVNVRKIMRVPRGEVSSSNRVIICKASRFKTCCCRRRNCMGLLGNPGSFVVKNGSKIFLR